MFACASIFVACARTEPDAGSTPSAAPDPNVYAQGVCNWFARCVPSFVRSNYGTVAACVDALEPRASALFRANGATVTKRSLDACIVRTESAPCDEEIESLPECDFKGTLPDGAPCTSGIVCASGSCLKGAAGCGVCAMRVGVNESCVNAACAPGLACVAEQCMATSTVNGPCSTEHRCAGNLACLDGTCVIPRGLDEPCSEAFPKNTTEPPCDATRGLVCGVLTPGESLRCVALLASVGGSCSQTPFCEVGVCVHGTCVPLLSNGQTCVPGAEVGCAPPLECRDGVCAGVDPTRCH